MEYEFLLQGLVFLAEGLYLDLLVGGFGGEVDLLHLAYVDVLLELGLQALDEFVVAHDLAL